MKLKDLIENYPYILDIPTELLETVNWDKLEESKDDYTFQDASDLVDTFINSIKGCKIINFEGETVMFTYRGYGFDVVDTYNDFNATYDYPEEKVKVLHNLLYYFVKMEDWSDIYTDMNISVRDYKELKERLI